MAADDVWLADSLRVRGLKAVAARPILKPSTTRVTEEPRMEQDSASTHMADGNARDAHDERLIDEALMDTFPASDPIAPTCFD
jgi:hypothetical protein